MPHSASVIRDTYPVPANYFTVEIDGETIPFQSVDGLNHEIPKITYRDGMRGYFQMPGLYEPPEITLTRGVFRGDKRLLDWFHTVNFNEVEKKDVVINLTDPSGENIIMSWSVENAFPLSYSSPSLNGSNSDVATITVTLACDRIKVSVVN
ncbi:TPA: phage tail protein [Enterobacter bugandensis]|nr:phage tail protein [Enterobacter bugandensis]